MLQDDSRRINDGDTFIALKGYNDDGHKYVLDAIKNGAKKVIVEHGEYDVQTLIVDNTNEYLNKYIKMNNIDVKLIGVTGTNGKTTTSYVLYQLLNMLGIKSSYIGTLGYIINDELTTLRNTTPGKLEIYNLLKDSYNNNIKYVVMEVSSQAYDQGRVNNLEFDYMIYTNLSRDHLDYHKNMKNYLNTKINIFSLLKDTGMGIINIDDKYSNYFKIGNYKTYGINGDYKIDNRYNIPLIGNFNKYNVTAALSVLYDMGYTYDDLKDIVTKIKAPMGRMEVVEYNTNKIIIDYAHTPDAVMKVINTCRELDVNKIITIIGCGGNRDKGKRPIMGDIATKLSDYVIFTSDNPRYEDPDKIIEDIVNNLDNNKYEIESNREIAIKKGIQLLSNDDILLVLGKGHEKYQIIKDTVIPFDDKLIVLENI